jgi:osmotically-inducible protein OsmY
MPRQEPREVVESTVAVMDGQPNVSHVDPNTARHQVEHDVRRHLLSHPDFRFASLVVRRVENGVCLQGVLEAGIDSPDVCTVVQAIDGVRQVLNHLLVTTPGITESPLQN